ncbi:MAG: C4-type zinc ribbon domain-containing protein, partial [Clostridia bacterium]|nr:C4-type zinc ribbon domain-containing protein [Clostridia bacterium]
RKIESALANCPERIKAMQAKKFLLDSEENVIKMDKRAKDLLSHLEKAQQEYKDISALIKEYEDTLNTLKSEDEISYLAKKINQKLDTLRSIEREADSLSREMEEVSKSFALFRAKYNAARTEYSKNKEMFDQIKQEKQEPVNQINQKLSELAKTIKPELLSRYNKKRADKIFPVLVPVRENMCGGCSMQISLQQMDRLKNAKIIECENCQRIIYI